MRELRMLLIVPPPHDVLIVNVSDGLSGWELAEQIRRCSFKGKTLALLDDLGHPGAGHLMQLPQTECVRRPSSPALLDELLRSILAQAVDISRQYRPDPPPGGADGFYGIVGKSPAIREIFSRIDKVASRDVNVCIYGESGTGKELIARAIHAASPRRDRPFITLDCTAIPEGLMESHLFGHVRGAFTSAVEHREGLFSLAHTGTLFADEICELSLPLQAKLLRVIPTHEFLKVGGTKPIRSDIRLVTATNKDPQKEVRNGTFREDLYYRIGVVMIEVPPLRERKEDIPLIVDYCLRKFSVVYNKRVGDITRRAMDRLMAFPWPGNVRQLQNLIEQAVVLAEGETLTARDIFNHNQPSILASLQLELGLPLSEVERRYLLRTLQQVHGNRTEAAKILGISRRGLLYRLESYLREARTTRSQTNQSLEEG